MRTFHHPARSPVLLALLVALLLVSAQVGASAVSPTRCLGFNAASSATPAGIRAFTALVGGRPCVAPFTDDMEDVYQFWTPSFAAVAATGATPMQSLSLQQGAGWDAAPPLKDFASGVYDAWFTAYAQQAAAWGKPYLLRPAWEMNQSQSWGMGVNGNTPADYIAFWRHLHDLFRANGAANTRWVWCPGITSAGLTPLASLYPGDAYVDYTCLDGYNEGTTWRSFSQIFDASIQEIRTFADKPMIIGEVATGEKLPNGTAGNKAAWITSMFLTEIPEDYPEIAAVIWFDFGRGVYGGTDWRVNSSPGALAAYKEVVANAGWQGMLG